MRVVVIEDNPGDARLIQEMLKASGSSYELAVAPDLTQGLHLLAAQPADVVLLDLGLPESYGLETLGRLQSRASELPIVITTSIDDMSLAVQAVARGAEDYLVKGQIDPVLLSRTLAYSIERKRMKVALKRSEEQYRRIVETTSEGIAVTDARGEIVFANARLSELLGYSSEEIVSPDRRDFFVEEFKALAGLGPENLVRRAAAQYEMQFARKDGSELWVLVNANAIRDERGRLRGALFMLSDISQRKRAEADLGRYRDHLEELVRERTAELAELNEQLAREVSVRKQAEHGLRALSRRLFQAQEDERRAISRELHDEIGQMLTGLLYRLESAKHAEPSQAAKIIPEAQEVTRDLLTQLRNLSHNLRPSMLDELGLLPSLSAHCKQFSQLMGIAVDFAHERVPEDLSPEISTAAYRIVQEALTNVARHAGVTRVTTRIWADGDRLHILVQDQGKGFDPASVAGSSGLSGMRERAALLDGLLTIDSFPGRGTRIAAELPLGQAPAP
jgi:two-component system sensor histidine kinase UhpB